MKSHFEKPLCSKHNEMSESNQWFSGRGDSTPGDIGRCLEPVLWVVATNGWALLASSGPRPGMPRSV